MRRLKRLFIGQGMVEFVLILALVSITTIISLTVLSDKVSNTYDTINSALSLAETTSSPTVMADQSSQMTVIPTDTSTPIWTPTDTPTDTPTNTPTATPTPPYRNIALQGTASADSYFNDYPPFNVIDDSLATSWKPSQCSGIPWVEIDLLEPHYVHHIEVIPSQTGLYSFSLMVDNGDGRLVNYGSHFFIQIAQAGQVISYTFPSPLVVQRLRLFNGSCNGISEYRIYETTDADIPTATHTSTSTPTRTHTPTATATATPTGTPIVPQRWVFRTSQQYVGGDLGGLAGADAKCQAHANAAGLPGTYKAWLSASGEGNSAAERLTHYDAPYKLVNGTIIAYSWSDLTDGSLVNPINIDEYGNSATTLAWTGTTIYGNVYKEVNFMTCGDWYDRARRGLYGRYDYINYKWTQNNIIGCDSSYALICMQQ